MLTRTSFNPAGVENSALNMNRLTALHMMQLRRRQDRMRSEWSRTPRSKRYATANAADPW